MSPATHVEYTKLMVHMLVNHCPNLEDLQIFQDDLPDDPMKTLFSTARWPTLRRLAVGGESLEESADLFFACHQSLGCLCIGVDDGRTIPSIHISPNLRFLNVGWGSFGGVQ